MSSIEGEGEAYLTRLRQWLPTAVLIASSLALQGCTLLMVGAAAGAGAGAVSYVGNEVRATHEVTVDRAWEATQTAYGELGFPVISGKSRKDALGGTLAARNAQDQLVSVRLIRQSDSLTEIRVRIGTFSTAANRAAAQVTYDRIRARL